MEAERRTANANSDTETCRVALLCTPRTGNTWLRHLLCDGFDLNGFAATNPDDFDWANIPTRCLLAIHWPKTEAFRAKLMENGFRIVVLTRHPLDVLISIFRFAKHSRSCDRWLEGMGGDESALRDCSLGSPEFVKYATSERARALLDVSFDWWTEPDALRLRYEDLVQNPAARLNEIAAQFGWSLCKPVEKVVGEFDANAMRTVVSQHVWQGKPGLWRKVLAPDSARAIANAHELCFVRFNYPSDVDASVAPHQSAENWLNLELDLVWKQAKQTHQLAANENERGGKLGTMIEEINAKRAARAGYVDARLSELYDRINATYLELAALRAHVGELQLPERLHELESAARVCNAPPRLAELERRMDVNATVVDSLNPPTLLKRIDAAESRLERLQADTRIANLQSQCESLKSNLAKMAVAQENSPIPNQVADLIERMNAVLRHLAYHDENLTRIADVGPNGLSVAHGLRRFATKYPTAASILKRITGRKAA